MTSSLRASRIPLADLGSRSLGSCWLEVQPRRPRSSLKPIRPFEVIGVVDRRVVGVELDEAIAGGERRGRFAGLPVKSQPSSRAGLLGVAAVGEALRAFSRALDLSQAPSAWASWLRL